MKKKTYGKIGNKIGALISDFAISVMRAEKPIPKNCRKEMHDPLYIDKFNKAHSKCVYGIIEVIFKALD